MGDYRDTDSYNGSPPFKCPMVTDWEPTKEKVENYMQQASDSLKAIASTLEDVNTNLVGPATGRRQIPLEVVIALILLWGVYNVFLAARDSHKDIKINWTDGLVITDSGVK